LIDPGPDVASHVRALVAWMGDAATVKVILTHGHRDHTGAAREVADALDAPIFGPPGMDLVERPLADGETIETDEGALVAVHTPGHAREHLSYLWRARRALFVGDLLLGRGDTTWVAGYPGCVADYLASLARLRTMDLDVIYPAHGPPLDAPGQALDRFESHRRARILEVEAAVGEDPAVTPESLVAVVYGPDLPPDLRRAAVESLAALLEHVQGSAKD
jgi:hydroxyacylglutathione hydrolase